ncbi:GNAT family N-acetyltransferase [Smaragdicoccus niigatensis]|uniref:GNAT family N-acetyltransferase n=1 Tax=Smaragdicoccus niigatensis TaxID=359359 RepID=UPI0003730E69
MTMIRPATADDAAACAQIYAPVVTDTAVTFEYEPPSAEELARRIEAAHVWLVAVENDTVLGYAYGGPFATRAAFARTCEVSVYLAPDARGKGLGRQLYTVLLERLRDNGLHVAISGIALPNDVSIALHTSFGFELVGIYREVGHKFNQWHDLARYQLRLGD